MNKTKMSEIWKQKSDALKERILNTPLNKDGLIKQLYYKKGNCDLAFLRCIENERGE